MILVISTIQFFIKYRQIAKQYNQKLDKQILKHNIHIFDLFIQTQIKIKNIYTEDIMIDLIIIAAYLFLIVRALLQLFKWIQNKFSIYGRQQAFVLQNEQTNNIKIQNKPVVVKQKQASSKLKKQAQIQQYKPKSVQKQKIIYKSNEQRFKETETIKKQLNEQKTSSLPQQIKNQKQDNSNIKHQPKNQVSPQQVKVTETTIKNQQSTEFSTKDQQVSSLRKQIQELKSQNKNLVKRIQFQIQQSANYQQAQWNLKNQIQTLKHTHDASIIQMKNQHYKQVQMIKSQLQSQPSSNEVSSQNTQLKSQNKIAQTVNQKIQASGQTQNSNQIVNALQSRIQQMKNQLQFCQDQLKTAYQSQAKLKEQIQQLTNSSSLKSRLRGPVSISDVFNHPQYLRVKQKLQKYESGISSSRPRSIIRAQFTPQGDKNYKTIDSRISQRRSFISSKISDGPGQNSQQIFGQCSFLNQQNKSFLSDEIKRIKKLAIKKTKLIFRLDKLHPTNPHQLIDNIPNVVILIELTNGKILGAFTQVAFSRQDGNDKGSVARSKLGANKAMIIDLSNKVSFSNNSPNDTIIYDENAIVFGKDELVIKNDQPTLLYSSFGTHDGVYWDGKYSLEEYLGSSHGFQRINQYQFHRIYIS